MQNDWTKAPETPLSESYKAWLKVKRLSHHFGFHCSEVTLKLLSMSYKDPRDYEAQALTLDAHEKCFVREIMLINQDNRECLSHGRVCIRGDNQKAIDLLENLGEKALGEHVLHHDSAIHRSDFLFRQAYKEELKWFGKDLASNPWSRYSVFSKDNHPWLVLTETLSMSLEHLIDG